MLTIFLLNILEVNFESLDRRFRVNILNKSSEVYMNKKLIGLLTLVAFLTPNLIFASGNVGSTRFPAKSFKCKKSESKEECKARLKEKKD